MYVFCVVPEIIRGLMTSGYGHCSFTQSWADIVDSPNASTRYRSGGLGKKIVPGIYRVWLCDGYDTCHGKVLKQDMMCCIFNEKLQTFLAIGPNSKVKFVASGVE